MKEANVSKGKWRGEKGEVDGATSGAAPWKKCYGNDGVKRLINANLEISLMAPRFGDGAFFCAAGGCRSIVKMAVGLAWRAKFLGLHGAMLNAIAIM